MTYRELAKHLNVSPAALSLAVNNKPGISAATRERILMQLQEMGMSDLIKQTPSEHAAGSNQGSIGFIVYKRTGEVLDRSPFFLLIMEALENQARKYEYNLVFATYDRKNILDNQIVQLQNLGCKGAVIFATEMQSDDLAIFSKLNYPCVFLDNTFAFHNVDCVAVNNTLGTYQAISHLVSMGHTEIGYLKSSSTYVDSFQERGAGFANALRFFGLELHPQHIYEVNFTEEGSYADLRNILQSHPSGLPTAFVTDDDTIAAGAMRALTECGYRIPEDVSLIGFDDRPICEMCSPKMTTIRIPKFSFGATAIDLLVKRLEEKSLHHHPGRSQKTHVGTELVVRDTVRRIERNPG